MTSMRLVSKMEPQDSSWWCPKTILNWEHRKIMIALLPVRLLHRQRIFWHLIYPPLKRYSLWASYSSTYPQICLLFWQLRDSCSVLDKMICIALTSMAYSSLRLTHILLLLRTTVDWKCCASHTLRFWMQMRFFWAILILIMDMEQTHQSSESTPTTSWLVSAPISLIQRPITSTST